MKKGISNYELFDDANIYEKRGLFPHQIVDFKGFTGDSADNYPGVKGIGEKTATKLLQTYGEAENIIENIDQLSKGVQTKLNENLEMFYLSRQLAEIKCELAIDCPLAKAVVDFDAELIDEKIKSWRIRFRPLA